MSSIAPIIDFDDKNYNPFLQDEEAYGDIEDIHSLLARLRARAPVHQGDLLTLLGWSPDSNFTSAVPQFTVLGYQEVMEVDGDPETGAECDSRSASQSSPQSGQATADDHRSVYAHAAPH
jgi:hypothetical protein